MSNSDNPRKGSVFQRRVLQWFEEEYKKDFISEKKIPIGNPPKDHKFDIVAADGTIAAECKRYTWTESGNVPSAKLGTTNEAAFYLSFLPDSYAKYIVMMKAVNKKRGETLADYYYRTYRHLLGDIKVLEYDPDMDKIRPIGQVEKG